MRYKSYKILVVLLIIALSNIQAQEFLNKNEAVKIALENNFDIRTADNNVRTARNNANIKNSKYLPSVAANGSATFSVAETENTLHDGTTTSTAGVKTTRYNANIGLNYTLFDGLGRENIYRSLK